MIEALTLIARLLLAVVFAVAGGAKLADRAGTRRAVVDFGAPELLARPLALLLPLAELAVAALLLPATTAPAGAVGSLALLVLFSTAIAINLARGRTPDCHCFGQLHSAPAGWTTVARNGLLAAVAGLALAGSLDGPDRSALAWIGRLAGAELLALAVAVAAIALLVVGGLAFLSLLRSYGRVLVRLERVEARLVEAGFQLEEPEAPPELGLKPGTPAPAFAGLDDLLAPGLPVLLLFTSPRCGPCQTLLPQAAAWQRDHADTLTVAFVSDGTVDEARAEAEEFELEHVVHGEGREVYDAFQASGTPSAVLIASDGTIGSWVAPGRDWIEALVAGAIGSSAETRGLPVGTEPPALELPSLDGRHVALADFRGRATLLLFWNPDCGFCRAMHDDLLAWEGSSNGVTPRLVVVSSGDAESTLADGFRSTVLLDESFAAGATFGANGTPMAVLLDPDGRVASGVVAGAEAVLALADGRL
jgi:thiol-disulfide isomerase/thioredoxin